MPWPLGDHFMTRRTGIAAAIVGALLIAGVSTLGDAVWFELRLRHRPAYGLAHGAILFLCIGLYLGAVARRPWAGAGAGAAIGSLAAGAYYMLAPWTGHVVMFVIWMALWVAVAALAERLAGPPLRWPRALGRGAIAAVLSGCAFYAISGIWSAPPPDGRNYLLHFASWTLAYLPAFLALLYRR